MKLIRKVFVVGYSSIVCLFICCALALIFFAVLELWHGINPGEALAVRERFTAILESIGLLTIAVVALEGQANLLPKPNIAIPYDAQHKHGLIQWHLRNDRA